MDSTGNGSIEPSASSAANTGGTAAAVDKGVDFATYFSSYAFLDHQRGMLSDRVRMDAYYNAVFQNRHHFNGKVVLDVGTGSGILAIWCALAGAKKVYAVEATEMADFARELTIENQVDDIVNVIEGLMEDVTLPEKVDVIISEWMGHFLLRESMFDSVICARDRWLKPDGVMYPSHARMWLAPISTGLGDQKMNDFESAMDDWFKFVYVTKARYRVNMSVLTEPYQEEKKKYYLKTSLRIALLPDQVIGCPAIIAEIDCLTATIDEIRNISSKNLIPINDKTILSGFAGWFDVHFRGSKQNPVTHEIELTTAPSTDNTTHWGQQVFLFGHSCRVNAGDLLMVSFLMSRSKKNHRLMDLQFTYEIQQSSGNKLPPVASNFYID